MNIIPLILLYIFSNVFYISEDYISKYAKAEILPEPIIQKSSIFNREEFVLDDALLTQDSASGNLQNLLDNPEIQTIVIN